PRDRQPGTPGPETTRNRDHFGTSGSRAGGVARVVESRAGGVARVVESRHGGVARVVGSRTGGVARVCGGRDQARAAHEERTCGVEHDRVAQEGSPSAGARGRSSRPPERWAQGQRAWVPFVTPGWLEAKMTALFSHETLPAAFHALNTGREEHA